MAERDFPRASLVEGIRFTAQVAAPNLIQGLFRRRRKVATVKGLIPGDGLGTGFMSGLKRGYGNGPLWIRAGSDNALLILGEAAIRRVLDGSPDPFASDPEPKRSAMAHFQPDAVTISRQPEWAPRRAFAEAVLDTGRPRHRLTDRFATVCAEETARLAGSLDWDIFNAAVRRVTRRIVLGDAAAEDEELSQLLGELMDKSNPPGGGDDELYLRYLRELRRHVSAAEQGSLAGLIGEAPAPGGDPAGQVTHWLFALGDTLAINAYRCLALLASQTQVRTRVLSELDGAKLGTAAGVDGLVLLGACLQEAMRIWPTTPMLARETVHDFDWNGTPIPAGTQCLIVNSFNHRDRDVHPWADYFSPDEWLPGGAATEDWTFNHFSHGPQGCPGAGLAVFVGRAMLAGLLQDNEIEYVTGPLLEAGKPLPHDLDFFGLRFELTPRS